MKRVFYSCLVLIALISVSTLTQAQTKEWSKKDAEKWYNSWLKDHKANHPGPTLDVQEFAKQYHANPKWWDEAFAFLERKDLASLPVGAVAIDGTDVSAVVSEGAGHDFSTTKWESHKAVADIHFLISGNEMVALAPKEGAEITKPFGTSDTQNYKSEGKPYAYTPGNFFIIFPSSLHQPGVKSPDGDKYKKVVVKVKVI